MSDEASRVVQDAATLRKWQIKLGRDFFELGRELEFTRDFIHDLNGVRVSLSDTGIGYRQGIDAKRVVAYARVQGLLGSLLDFLSELARRPRGSEANTRYASNQLDAILKALAELSALSDEVITAPPPAPTPPESAIPHLDHTPNESVQPASPKRPAAQLTIDDLRQIEPVLTRYFNSYTPGSWSDILAMADVRDYIEVNLSGSPAQVANAVLLRLNERGAIAPGDLALGRLLRYLLSQNTLPQASRDVITSLGEKYELGIQQAS